MRCRTGTNRPAWPVRIAVLFLLLLPVRGAAQPAPLAGLDDYIMKAMADWQVPGLAIAVVRNDSVIHARGYGVRELGRPERVDEHTLFAIASTTKAMTTAALGMLVDEKRLSWDDPVSRHLSGFELADPFVSRAITIRDLVTHRAGLSRSDNLWIAAPFDRAEIVHRARLLPPASGFRQEYGYHNVLYIAAGEVVGAVSGLGWDGFLEERLFRPLGMTRSTSRSAVVDTRDNVATAHTRNDGRVVSMARRNYDNIGGAGAVFSSVHDMAQWLRLHLNRGSYNGTQLLSVATVKELHAPQTVIRADTATERMFPDTHLRAYALGWNVQDYHGRRLVHHSGSINFTRTQVGMLPDQNVGVVVITNLSSSNLQAALTYRVLDALLGLPTRDWSAEYLVLQQRADERAARSERELTASRLADTRPALPLEAYAGTYTSELYGTARVTLEDGRLVLRYAPEYVADLEHWHHETFRGTWRQRGFGRAFVTFSLDRRARVKELELEGFGEFAAAPTGPGTR